MLATTNVSRRRGTRFLASIILIGTVICFAKTQDCESCITVPCQNPIPQASDILWTTCLSCLQQAYPTQCQTASTCAYYLISLYSDPLNSISCCSSVYSFLLSNVAPRRQNGASLSCSIPPSSLTPRSPVGAAPLPYVSSNGQPLQYIIPQMNFSCQGCLQMLNITLMGGVSADSSFYLQLWRRYTAISGQSPVSSDLYQLNTSVLLTISALAGSSSNVYSLAINVCFHEGDTIGIQLPYNSLLRIATDSSSVIYKRDIPAQCTDVVSGIFQPSLNYTGAPLITLIMAPSPSSSSPSPLAQQITVNSSLATTTIVLSLGATSTTNLCTVEYSPLTTTVAVPSAAIGLGVSACCAASIAMIATVICSIKVVIGRRRRRLAIQLNEVLIFDNRHKGRRSTSDHKTIDSYASSYQVNGQLHVYQELGKSPSPACKTTEFPVYQKIAENVKLDLGNPSISCLSRLSSTFASEPNLSCYSLSLPSIPMGSSVGNIAAASSDCAHSNGIPSISNHHQTLPPLPFSHSSGFLTNSGNFSDEKHWLIDRLLVDQDKGGTTSSSTALPQGQQQVLGTAQDGYSCLTHFRGMNYDHNDPSPIEQNEMFWDPPSSTKELYDVLSRRKYREIHRNDLSVVSTLGSGNFGTVCKGVWTFPGGHFEVAMKMLKDGASEEDKVKFLQEAAIMGQFSHPNVVKLYGVVTVGDPVVMLLELVPNGDLRNFVLSCRPQGSTRLPSPIPISASLPKTFIAFAKDIACGMTYLSRKNYVHRDLAARNIFLTEDLRCKIGDFGMARDLTESYAGIYQSQGGTIPLKWSAPEAIKHHQYNTASDVWSFGMVLYEVWSLGHKPFENESLEKYVFPYPWNASVVMANGTLFEVTTGMLADLVTSGYCQPPPPGCPRTIYGLMVQCWNPKAAKRPSFSELYRQLGRPVEELLEWCVEDRQCGELVTELGAPMACSRNLYPDLQNSYTK